MDLNNQEQIKLLLSSAHLRSQLKFSNLDHPNEIRHKAQTMTLQVGGTSDSKDPILKTGKPYDCALKPLQNDHRGIREMIFYEIVTSAKCILAKHQHYLDSSQGSGQMTTWMLWFQSWVEWVIVEWYRYMDRQWYTEINHLCQLSEFIIDYHGIIMDTTCSCTSQNTDQHHHEAKEINLHPLKSPKPYIVLTDATIGFEKPCIMDIKIGTMTYEPDAKPSKIQSQRNKYPQQEVFGFRIVGLQVYDPNHPMSSSTTGYRTMDKIDGRKLKSKDAILATFQVFFKVRNQNNVDRVQREILEEFLRKLIRLRRWFSEKNESFVFYASSLLFVYEGARQRSLTMKGVNLKLIDFAHVRKHNGKDVGFLHGLDMIISIFAELLQVSIV